MGLYIIMLGVQGAGKGMQAGILAEHYGIPHVSTGDIFRAMKTRDDDLAREVQEIMKAGQLVSDDLTCRIVEDRLDEDDAVNGVILDGFPRNTNQANWLKEHLADKGQGVTAVVLMEIDYFVAFKRTFGRIQVGGGSYNIYYNNEGLGEWKFVEHPEKAYPPRLEVDGKGKEVKRRPDDANAHSIIKRIEIFEETTSPLIAYYKEHHLVEHVYADQPIEVVTMAIRSAIDARQAKKKQ